MKNHPSRNIPSLNAPRHKTLFFAVAPYAVAFGALLASGYSASTSFGAPPFVPIASTNEQASNGQGSDATKPGVIKKPVIKDSGASSPRMSTHVAAWKTTPDGFAPLSYFAANCARCHGPNGSFYGDSFARTRDDASLRQIVHDMAFGPAQAPIDDAKLEVLTAYHRSLIGKKPFLSLSSAVVGSATGATKNDIVPNGGAKPANTRQTSTSEKAKKSGTTPKAPQPKSTTRKSATAKAATAKAATAKAATAKAATAKAATAKAATASMKPVLAKSGAAQKATGEILTLQGEATPGARVTLTQGSRTIEAQRSGDTWKASLPVDPVSSQIEITAKKDDLETVLRPGQNAFSHSTTQAKNSVADSSSTNDSKADGDKK